MFVELDVPAMQLSANHDTARCLQVAATPYQTAEQDGTGWKLSGLSFARDSKEMSVKVASRKEFLLGGTNDFNSRRLDPLRVSRAQTDRSVEVLDLVAGEIGGTDVAFAAGWGAQAEI